MDIVTHGITGILVSLAVPSGHKASVMAAGLIGALAPDLDAIARLWDPMSAITVHRTATHSILGGGIVALAVAGLMWAFRHESFLLLFGGAYLGVLSHAALDLLTPFGTAILWPLSDRRFALSRHHVIDPIFSTIVLTFLIASFKSKQRRTFLARMGLTGIMLYVVVTGAYQRMAVSRWHGLMESHGITPIRSAVIPLFPGPFRWLGVAETDQQFYQQTFWLYRSTPEPPVVFAKTKKDIGHTQQLKSVQHFLNFARFPWKREFREGSYRVIEYRDLAFADHPLGGPLSLQIWTDESGNVIKVEFGHRF
jgi:membrane-bound metal-dependent hydrolase YbcI (DUF457 family)